MKTLKGNSISKKFTERLVVNKVNISVSTGEIVGLLGPNGAGKTTTFLMMLGVHKPNSGEILLNDIDITDYPVYKRARMGISFLPQEPSILRGLSIEDNLIAIKELNKKSIKKDIKEVLKEMGLYNIKNRRAYLLSGGERRRLEIARALLLSPDFLLLDEPFAGIDPIQIKEIQDLIIDLKTKGIGIIITDHNVREILKITDRSYIINRGELIFQGNSFDLIKDEKVINEYLGKEFVWN